MSSPDSRSGSRRSRSRSRSRSPRTPRTPRRGRSRSRSYSGSGEESFGGSSRSSRRDLSRSSAKKISRKRRRSRSEDPDTTPRRHVHEANVPVRLTRHAEVQSSDSSDDEDDDDDKREGLDRNKSRAKKIKKVDVSNPLSTFRRQVQQRRKYLIPSDFAKKEWLGLRKMDANGNFIKQEDNKADEWKNVAKSDRLIRRNAGDVFADTRLDEGLHAIVDKDSSSSEGKKLIKQQRTMGAIAHLTLQALENYSKLYEETSQLVTWCIGKPCVKNPQWTGEEDTVHPEFVDSQAQEWYRDKLLELQRELQVDLADPLANITRVAAESFTKALDERREKVIAKIKKTNSKAAAAITTIPPSAHFMFGGDHTRLAKVVELTKDLSSTANKSFITPTNSKYKGGRGGGGGKPQGGPRGGGREHGGRGGAPTRGPGGHKKRRSETEKGEDSFRGGNSHRGGKH